MNRTSKLEGLDLMGELDPNETAIFMFAAKLEDGKKPEIAIQDMTTRVGGKTIQDMNPVHWVVKELVKIYME
jgi:hypothetical protein